MDKAEKNIGWFVILMTFLIMIWGTVDLTHKRTVTLRVGVYAGSYWDSPNGDCYRILDQAIKRFESEHEGVKVEYVSGIGSADYSEWLTEQILMDREPDVYFVLPEDFDLLVTSGALAPLDHLILLDGSFDTEAYYEPCLSAGRRGGIQYALPQESVPTIMFVNKTLLSRAGIDMPAADWTWNDCLNICQQVTERIPEAYSTYDYSWNDALYANNASLFSERGDSCSLTDSNIRDAIRFISRLEEMNHGRIVTSRDFDLGNVVFRPFLYSEYRMYQPFPWRVKKYTNFEWDGLPMPAGPDGDNVSVLQTMLMGMSSRADHPELAWEFLKLLCYDREIQLDLYKYSRGISPIAEIAENSGIVELLQKDIPGTTEFDAEVIHRIMTSAVEVHRFPGYDRALMMAENGVREEAENDSSRGDGLLSLQREINEFLSENK
ncbi:MAG: extracellular solute-binding protein [Solobacterium sp.]|nr:extracellular solute-binding protein [Solobacterium sp.]